MTKWEYKILQQYQIAANDWEIKKLGEEGWELLVARSNAAWPEFWDMIFKRPVMSDDELALRTADIASWGKFEGRTCFICDSELPIEWPSDYCRRCRPHRSATI